MLHKTKLIKVYYHVKTKSIKVYYHVKGVLLLRLPAVCIVARAWVLFIKSSTDVCTVHIQYHEHVAFSLSISRRELIEPELGSRPTRKGHNPSPVGKLYSGNIFFFLTTEFLILNAFI